MTQFLGPTLIQQVGDSCILWFKKSNQYVIVEKTLFDLITCFLESDTKTKFEQVLIQSEFDIATINNMYSELSQFLDECNRTRLEQDIPGLKFDSSRRLKPVYYQIGSVSIEIYYASEYIKNLIHPQLAHVSIDKKTGKSNHVFDIYMENDDLCLFKDESIIGSYHLKEYHLMQGKFAMLLLYVLTQTVEEDWLGTFHASTVEKHNKAVMIIGDSGSGKSTFTALLSVNNFRVLADDITPMLEKNTKVYSTPGGISIKSGAFDVLESVVSNFESLPLFYINPYKGYVKYMPSNQEADFFKGYACSTMVCINYQKNAATCLEEISINEALEILIPESWLAPQLKHAKTFLNWIKEVRFYKLTYSDYDDGILKFSELFES